MNAKTYVSLMAYLRGEKDMETTIKTKGYKCDKCGHTWAPKQPTQNGKIGVFVKRPRMCPKCKTVKWDDGKGAK